MKNIMNNKFKDITVINGFFNDTECKAFIDSLENKGAMCAKSDNLASAIWSRLSPKITDNYVIDEYGEQWIPSGVDANIRLYKNYKSNRCYYNASAYSRTMGALIIYLNDVGSGYDYFPDLKTSVIPKTGRALFFKTYDTKFTTLPLIGYDTKYILQVDIIYTLIKSKSYKLQKYIFSIKKDKHKDNEQLSKYERMLRSLTNINLCPIQEE